MSYHVTQFYQAFPRVNTASDKRWGEKAWVRGYVSCTLPIEVTWYHYLGSYWWIQVHMIICS